MKDFLCVIKKFFRFFSNKCCAYVSLCFVLLFSGGANSARSTDYKVRDEKIVAGNCSKDCDVKLPKKFVHFVKGVKFFLPNYPEDLIQRFIVKNQDFYEGDILRKLDEYMCLPDGAVGLDVGSNIGNHTIYWSKQKKVKKIYSFEPLRSTFDILKTNIDLNKLNNKVELFNMGLSDKRTKAVIEKFCKENIGATHIKDTPYGDMDVDKLDNIKVKENRIDFVKIDVEGHEVQVLKGAKETFKKYKPRYVFVESFSDKFKETKRILESYGYRLTDFPVKYSNYLFKYGG